ncbi:MAG TPA: 30S ribosomal protein S17 [Patescibacteria group bacterium]|nr:30S ribosomal protein S17 [Patescibacteria group bacterium]
MEKENKKILRKLEGAVVSDKMDKTVVVKVDRQVTNKKYQKKYTVSKKYKCHDARNEYKEGDQVVIVACRPLSKDKRWRVFKKLN